MPPVWYTVDTNDIILKIRVQTRSSRDQIVGVHGDHLRIRITAPPVDGKANKHLIRYLASLFKVPVSRVTLLTGATCRLKRVRVRAPYTMPSEIIRLS
jgi:uncharacterized protein (TIGR00251 family)